jgi:hypothetical protein
VGWFRVDWNFHGSLHEGGIWREGAIGYQSVVHGKMLCSFPYLINDFPEITFSEGTLQNLEEA